MDRACQPEPVSEALPGPDAILGGWNDRSIVQFARAIRRAQAVSATPDPHPFNLGIVVLNTAV
jgi:hypothetical protein